MRNVKITKWKNEKKRTYAIMRMKEYEKMWIIKMTKWDDEKMIKWQTRKWKNLKIIKCRNEIMTLSQNELMRK